MNEGYLIPKKYLHKKGIAFFEAWEVKLRADVLPGTEAHKPLFIWAGKFVCGETVTITSQAKKNIQIQTGSLYVGIVNEQECKLAAQQDQTVLEIYADAAKHSVHGIVQAITLLTAMAGLPEAE